MATKFIRLEASINEWLDELKPGQEEEDMTDEQFEHRIVNLYEKKYFHKILEEKIIRVIQGEVTGKDIIRKELIDNNEIPFKVVFREVKDRLLALDYSIVDKTGSVVDTERFFSNIQLAKVTVQLLNRYGFTFV